MPCLCHYLLKNQFMDRSLLTNQFMYRSNVSTLCATTKKQFAKTILNHTNPPLGLYNSSRVWAPLFENSGSAP